MKSKLLLILVILSVFSCKKGEDDPAVTLASRTKRLAGDWVLKSCRVEGKYADGGVKVRNIVFTSDGSKFTYERDDTAKISYEGPHGLFIHFGKDGTMSVKEQFIEGYNLDGTWDFLHKEGASKNKERIMLRPNKVTAGSTAEFHALFVSGIQRIYHLRELRKDKLVMNYEGIPYTESGGETLNLKAEFLFVR